MHDCNVPLEDPDTQYGHLPQPDSYHDEDKVLDINPMPPVTAKAGVKEKKELYVSLKDVMRLTTVELDPEGHGALEALVSELRTKNEELEKAVQTSRSWADISEPEPQPDQ
eukprot:2463738-Karenia_brevis.AAC.1